nr:MAG TPA: hypothetical protein [Caudoviricetes sp.]DAV54143.1 MAG TPA: hypothetical protein [Caudoviricetes sp.]
MKKTVILYILYQQLLLQDYLLIFHSLHIK